MPSEKKQSHNEKSLQDKDENFVFCNHDVSFVISNTYVLLYYVISYNFLSLSVTLFNRGDP